MNVQKTIQSAFENHQKGNLERAEYFYKKALQKQPDNPDILHMLGVLFCQLANYDSAVKYIRKALQFKPSDIASAYCNLGVALQEKGQIDEAISQYQRAVEINPLFAKAYCNLGVALHYKGETDEAISQYRKAVGINPSFAKAYGNLGNALREKGDIDEAINCCQKAVRINPLFAEAYSNLGAALREKGSLDEAINCCQKAVEINPSFAEAYCNLGVALQKKGQIDKAITQYQKAIEIKPSFAKAHSNLGNALRELGQMDEAVTHCQKAIEISPSFAEAYCNLGSALREKGQIDDAITYCQKALEIDPQFAMAKFNMSVILLLSGDFEHGWAEYEWRWRLKDCVQFHSDFSKPLWDGSEVRGLTVLLQCEQGLGDTIQFIRYAPMIAQKGARVIVNCQRELVTLIRSVEGVQRAIAEGETLPEVDLYCPIMSLPLKFNTGLKSIPSAVPYLTVNSVSVQRWKDKVQEDNSSFKIGLVWAGRPEHKNDRNRSCRLECFSSLTELGDISFYSLQKGEAGEQAKDPPVGMKLIDYTEEIRDFEDTAALIENLDMTISVDTSVAHLAGALGKPVWILLPFAPDWRWMLDRKDSLWYPTMRLFRQPSPQDWESVMAEVKYVLLKLLNVAR
jgi:tetratricopeptide (TPR) repeat protein